MFQKHGMTTKEDIPTTYFQFARKFLMNEDLTQIDPDCDGPAIAAEIMESSTLMNECITCGQICDDTRPYKICCGGCQPQRHFHVLCISPKYREDIEFKCQLCDPSRREEYCFKCGEKPDATILNCKDKLQMWNLLTLNFYSIKFHPIPSCLCHEVLNCTML